MPVSFKSFTAQETEREATMNEAVRLLEEHAMSREAATLNAQAAYDASVSPIIIPGQTKPKLEVPLTPDDQQRLTDILQLMSGPFGKDVIPIVRRYMPNLFNEPTGLPN